MVILAPGTHWAGLGKVLIGVSCEAGTLRGTGNKIDQYSMMNMVLLLDQAEELCEQCKVWGGDTYQKAPNKAADL